MDKWTVRSWGGLKKCKLGKAQKEASESKRIGESEQLL